MIGRKNNKVDKWAQKKIKNTTMSKLWSYVFLSSITSTCLTDLLFFSREVVHKILINFCYLFLLGTSY